MDPLLVATDGGRSADGALELAAAYSAAHGVPVEVVSFVETLRDLPMPLPHRAELEQANAQGIAESVRQHVRDSVGPVDWPIHVKLGRPAPAICTTARARNARMVLLGVEPREGQANEIAVELLHLAEKPVLVTRGGGVPRDAVIGVDFSVSAVSAAEEAARLVGPGGRLHLVHVKPLLDFPAASVWGWGPCYECAVDGALDSLARRLGELGAGEVLRQTRSGDPAEELMKAVEELGSGLLAIGSDGYICNSRVVVGRVARRILAEASCAVLAMPVIRSLEGPFPGLDSAPQLASAVPHA